MIGIDTNVLVRYFTQDDVRQFDLATQLIERTLGPDNQGHVSLVALAELVWVLRSRFTATVAEVSQAASRLLSDPRFAVQDATAVWLALEAYEEDGVDLSDALIAAVDRIHGCTHTVTFDRKASRISGMTLLQ